MEDVVPGMPEGPYPDDWAAVHHLIDEGWMYSLRFDDGVTSAGFLLTPRGVASLNAQHGADAASLWRALLGRYPTLEDAFAEATPLMPIAFRSRIQHRLTRAAGGAVGADAARLRVRRSAVLDRNRVESPRHRAAGAGVRVRCGRPTRAWRRCARPLRCCALCGGRSDRSHGRGRVRGNGALRPVRGARDALLRDRLIRGSEPATQADRYRRLERIPRRW